VGVASSTYTFLILPRLHYYLYTVYRSLHIMRPMCSKHTPVESANDHVDRQRLLAKKKGLTTEAKRSRNQIPAHDFAARKDLQRWHAPCIYSRENRKIYLFEQCSVEYTWCEISHIFVIMAYIENNSTVLLLCVDTFLWQRGKSDSILLHTLILFCMNLAHSLSSVLDGMD
jgi:hypothetical protein